MPKFLGLEPKMWMWIGGGLIAVIVVVYALRSRGGGGAAASSEGAGDPLAGAGAMSAPPMFGGGPDSSGDAYSQQLAALEVESAKQALKEQQSMWELFFPRAQREQKYQEELAEWQYKVDIEGTKAVHRTIRGKKVECPKGEHLVVTESGGTACQPLGGGGVSFKRITQPVADIVGGLLEGGAKAAPEIGYQAAKYYAAPYTGGTSYLPPTRSTVPTYQGGQVPRYTPPIAPGCPPNDPNCYGRRF